MQLIDYKANTDYLDQDLGLVREKIKMSGLDWINWEVFEDF